MFLTPYTQGELTISFSWAMVKRSTFFRMSATDVLEGVLNHFLELCLYILKGCLQHLTRFIGVLADTKEVYP